MVSHADWPPRARFPCSGMNKVNLEDWYEKHGRKDLPWRNTRDPYAIYISEIMLQQTQVKTVLARFYDPFLKRFPTLQSLKEATITEVLKAWEGLGYYSRARNLHQAAIAAAPDMPDTVEGLMALPGIGRNTAHAIASFAFGLPVPVMEANVKRVLHRVLAAEKLNDVQLFEAAATLLGTNDPFIHNQAMMDIGAVICTPKAPRCLLCPLNMLCQGKTEPERYPAAKPKKAVPVRRKIILAARDAEGKLYLEAGTQNLLGGLYAFLQFDPGPSVTWQEKTYTLSGLPVLGTLTHVYSHFRLEGDVHLLQLTEVKTGPHWHTLEEIRGLPLSKADHKALALLEREPEQRPARYRRKQRA